MRMVSMCWLRDQQLCEALRGCVWLRVAACGPAHPTHAHPLHDDLLAHALVLQLCVQLFVPATPDPPPRALFADRFRGRGEPRASTEWPNNSGQVNFQGVGLLRGLVRALCPRHWHRHLI
jgi:hypothetical protein